MRIALIADIHANLTSLEAVLADIEGESYDGMVCLGDVAATGPQPHEVLMRLRAVGCPVVMGNADAWLLDPRPPEVSSEEGRKIADIDLWCAKQLTRRDLEFLESFQPSIELALPGNQTLLCFHGSPTSNTDIIRSDTPEPELDRMLDGRPATVMTGGHTHTPMVRRWRDVLLMNPGSVGLPYQVVGAEGQVRTPPWAEYSVLTAEEGRLAVELRRVPVDVYSIVRAALDNGMPHGVWWAGEWSRP
jgi:putative phosphoesterase